MEMATRASSLMPLACDPLPIPLTSSGFGALRCSPYLFGQIRHPILNAKPSYGQLHFARANQKSEKSSDRVDEDEDLKMSLKLPYDYLGKLPNDLRLDLNDAAFALSSGSLDQECGKQVGEVLMQLSRSWEEADTQACTTVGRIVPSLHKVLLDDSSSRSAIGRRFIKSGRSLVAAGQYERGELQKIGSALIAAGKTLLASGNEATEANDTVISSNIFKFGDLQVQLTSARAFTGSAIAFFFGILSWKLASALQRIPESSLSYANDNALLLATSLRGTLLAVGYSIAALSAFAMLGLVILGIELTSSEK
ncbi:hypothetical protein O6H91_12G094600 [Diphasiastrum complanatum]|uniref:Uncharacterized protein n=1 Tax=Diphasiastrum complanatum TaxID=34168 RepID=A0ACC2C4Z3_DIPCM|nr:hypothetical protein O6H91_12G094600 [Diphasiastrum complanatum]